MDCNILTPPHSVISFYQSIYVLTKVLLNSIILGLIAVITSLDNYILGFDENKCKCVYYLEEKLSLSEHIHLFKWMNTT